MPVHEGHRSRKKEQFRAHGLDAFADHEVLELLLYYAVPRQDTNPIAHRLMEKFGSLDAVFAADRAALEEVEGIGENASTLISHVPADAPYPRVLRRARDDPQRYRAGGRVLFRPLSRRAGGKSSTRRALTPRAASSLAIWSPRATLRASSSICAKLWKTRSSAARAVLLAHNHPERRGAPLPADNATTLSVFDALRTVGVELADHIIVADDDFVSLRHNGLLPERKGNGYGI